MLVLSGHHKRVITGLVKKFRITLHVSLLKPGEIFLGRSWPG